MSLDSMPISLRSSNQSENETNQLTFYDACVKGDLRVVKVYLSQQGFDMNIGDNRDGMTGFHFACRNDNLNVVQFLVRQGFDMNVGDNDGRTGFHWACSNGKLNVVQFIVQFGFDMNIGDNRAGMTGFHLACFYGKLNVVQFLVGQEFDMNVRDDDGRTGFHCACNHANLNIVRFLVQQGVDMNAGNNHDGMTGFHLACVHGHLKIVRFLVQQGFDMNVVDSHGWTGLKILIGRHNRSTTERFLLCALFLIEAGATLNENDVFEELISAIQNRIIEITFTEQIIFQKWTESLAQEIIDFTMEPYTNTSLQNLSQILD